MAERATSSPEEGQPTTQVFECAVCLQNCIHPVRLPCGHIFCFLCMKGVALQSKRCALCRTEIHAEYFNNPILVRQDDLLKDTSFEDGNWWYYEGRNGWWQYDERTSQEIEDQYKLGTKAFELLIAGFLYVIDLESMVQYRRNDPFRRRRVKRDLTSIPKKGVAGLKILSPVPCRSSGDGDERRDSGAQRVAPVPVSSSPSRVVTDANANGAGSTSTSPAQPTNPPNTRDCSPPGPSEDPTDDLATVISRLQLSPATQNQQAGNLANNGNSQDPNSFDYSDTSDEDWS